ncbi:MAG: radical SAM protein [Halobacteriota archaeon]
MQEEPLPLYRKAQLTFTDADLSATTDELWQIHDLFTKGERQSDVVVSPSLLDLKIEIAHRIHRSCHFCERRCSTDRAQKPGFCGVVESKYSSEFLHYGEERELVPSHTIFFTGCTLKCVFCQNWDIARHPNAGLVCDPQALARRIYARSMAGSRNVNWVGGDPTPHISVILETMRALATLEREIGADAQFLNVPMVFNSNAYYSTEACKLLDGVIDVYLSDFKYGNDACAHRYSNVDNYVGTVTRNLLASKDRLIVRHLVMPSHIRCCTEPIVKWVREHAPDVKFNLMFQYAPYNVVNYPEMNRYVNNAERRAALNIAKGLNLI